MKTLLVFRHAKSSWGGDAIDDHDRPLNKRGKQTAPRMGQWIAEQNAAPDLILSSTAKRARSTVKRAAKAMAYTGDIHYDRSLYLAPPGAYFQAIRTHAQAHARVMIVGHNPGLANLVEAMTGVARAFPTAALAVIRLPIESWQELQDDTTGELLHLWLPRELFA